MSLRPSKVGTIWCKGYCPGLTPRLLVKGSNRDQEFTNELSLVWGKKQEQVSLWKMIRDMAESQKVSQQAAIIVKPANQVSAGDRNRTKWRYKINWGRALENCSHLPMLC